MKPKITNLAGLPARILKWGLAAVAAELFYIFFFTQSAIEKSDGALLLLVPSMLEHIFCALAALVCGAVIIDLVRRENDEKK